MLSFDQLWLYGWHFRLNFAMDFADGFVVDDPLKNILKGGFW